MKSIHKKIIIILLVAIIGTIIILVLQISKTSDISVSKAELPLISTEAVEIPLDQTDPIYGNQGSAITIVEFLDLNNKASQIAHQTLVTFVTANPDKVRLIVKDFPASGFFRNDNYTPHLAAICASVESSRKYYEYLNELLAQKDSLKKETTQTASAEKIKLYLPAWRNCLTSTATKTRLEASISLAKSLGLKAAPEIFINNKKVNYLSDINLGDLLKEIIKVY